MAKRRSKTVVSGQTKIKTALENGEPIVGMAGYFYSPDLDCYIPLTVQALEISNGDECGVKLRCSIKGAVGDVRLDPCQVIDDKAAVEATIDLKRRQEEAEAAVNKISHRLITVRRARFTEFVNQTLSPENRDTIINDLNAAQLKLDKLDEKHLNDYVEAATEMQYGVSVSLPRYY